MPSPNSSIMLPLLPFPSATSIVLPKPGGLLKSQTPLRNAERHSQGHCFKDLQNYITISRYTSTVIFKAKAESWQKTCSSLSPKTRPSEVFSLLHSISGSPTSSSSDLSNFPSCHTPVDCANQFSAYLQSYFSTQTPKPFQSTEKAHMNKIKIAHFTRNTLHSTFCSPSSSLKLSSAISQLSNLTSSGPNQITYSFLTHFPQSALQFLLHIVSALPHK